MISSQGGERDRSLATSFHRAQQKHASRNRPSSSVNTNFSPAQGSTPAGPPNRLLETLSTIAVNHRGPPPLPRAELGIYGLNRWTVKCLELSRKRGIQTDKTPRASTEVVTEP